MSLLTFFVGAVRVRSHERIPTVFEIPRETAR